MSRLRKRMANHVDPAIHVEVEKRVMENDIRNQEDRSVEFLLVKDLFADSAYTPTNTMIYQFVEKIRNGEFDYISSIDDAGDYWDEWKKALVSFLASKNVLAKKKQN